MAATISGALKAYIESLGLRVAVNRDRTDPDEPLPLVVVQEGISIDTVPMGDFSDPAAETVIAELAQVSLFQAWRKPDGKNAESYTLARDLHRRLHGSQLLLTGTGVPPGAVHGVSVANHVRILDVDGPGSTTDPANGANVVQNVLTLRIRRNY